MGIEVSRRYLAAADLILFCEAVGDEAPGEAAVEGSGPASAREAFLAKVRAPTVLVRTKADLPAPAAASWEPGDLRVSIRTGAGLAELKQRLAAEAFGRLLGLGEVEPVVTRARHRVALERALAEVEAFHAARAQGVDAAATATHLRAAVGALDDLIGVVTPDDVLDRVFASFCVGK